ncbi:MAG: N-acetylmuramic acid 6-phosphate etherase [Saprospiraceae bacterium]
MEKITEQSSAYRHLEKMPVEELLTNMNREDSQVAHAVAMSLPSIAPLVQEIVDKMSNGGRLFYIGAGTSGRLGVLDASECPPTYGVPADWVIGIIAGGEKALWQSIEIAEDDTHQAWLDLSRHGVDARDVVIGITASGTTPYVIGGLKTCREKGITTGCITCNPHTPVQQHADYPIVVVVGPEFVTGSTRLKSGTAQKLVLNMISTSVMIRLGRVWDNKMVDMQLSNEKLLDRGARMLVNALQLPYDEALRELQERGSVRAVMEHHTPPS